MKGKWGYFIIKEGLSYIHEVTFAEDLVQAKQDLLWQINNDSDDHHSWSIREIQSCTPLAELDVVCVTKKPRDKGVFIPLTEGMLLFTADLANGYKLPASENKQ